MNYGNIHIAQRVLEVAGLPVPEKEPEIRIKAYEYLVEKDFLAAHQIRLGKNYSDFTKEDWKEIIEISGKDAVEQNMGARVACLRYGLI